MNTFCRTFCRLFLLSFLASFTSGCLPITGENTVAACAAGNSGSEKCSWRYSYSTDCIGRRCKNLVIYFAGGQMTCPDPILKPNSYLAKYSVREYVAVCAKIFQTSDGAGSIPLNQEATRVDLLMKDITSDPAITWAWSGERLLISGVSHGATAPVIAMARNDFDESSKHWKGSKLTAACFFDGIYDTDSFLKLNSAAKDTTPVGNSCSMYERAYGRYCRWPKLSNPNRPETWPHPSLCKSPQLAADTIRGVSPSQFAIKQWKLIECGSALPFCDQDMVPAAPIRQFCRLLNADPDHSCEFASFPDKPHMICGADEATMESCREWFDGLQ